MTPICNKDFTWRRWVEWKGIKQKAMESLGEWQMAGSRLALPHCSLPLLEFWPGLFFSFVFFVASSYQQSSQGSVILLPKIHSPVCFSCTVWFLFQHFLGHQNCPSTKIFYSFLSTDVGERNACVYGLTGQEVFSKKIGISASFSSSKYDIQYVSDWLMWERYSWGSRCLARQCWSDYESTRTVMIHSVLY